MAKSLSTLKKSEYERREVYNVLYELNENTREAENILRTCKPCKKKAQEAGLSSDELEPEKMELLINGFQAFINSIAIAKQKLDDLGYIADDTFDMQKYKDDCTAYFENQQAIAMAEQEKAMNERSEFSKKIDEIVAKYNELMNDEIQRVKKELNA